MRHVGEHSYLERYCSNNRSYIYFNQTAFMNEGLKALKEMLVNSAGIQAIVFPFKAGLLALVFSFCFLFFFFRKKPLSPSACTLVYNSHMVVSMETSHPDFSHFPCFLNVKKKQKNRQMIRHLHPDSI